MISPDLSRRLTTLLLAIGMMPVLAPAQAGNSSMDEVDVIELPADTPRQSRGFSLNWDCDVLLIEDSRRFRAGHCPGEQRAEAAQELRLEQAPEKGDDGPSQRRRKLIY